MRRPIHSNPIAIACLALSPAFVFASNPAAIIEWGDLGTEAGQFDTPVAIATGAGHVYVADFGNHRIQKFTTDGAYLSQWGTEGTGDGQLRGPSGIALDARGDVLVTDFFNHRVLRFSPEGELKQQWGPVGGAPGSMSGPAGIVIDGAGDVLVTDLDGQRIQKFNAAGAFMGTWQTVEGSELSAPWGIGRGADGSIYVADRGGDRIHRLDPNGRWLSSFGGHGRGTGAFRGPVGIAVSPLGNVFVSDHANHRVQVLTAEGAFVKEFLGEATAGGVHGLAIAGNDLYATDTRNHRVMRLVGAASETGAAARRIDAFGLALAGPNPSAHGTALRFALPVPARVTLEVHDIEGRRVRTLADGPFDAGEHVRRWDGLGERRQRIAAGVYFVLARFDDGSHVKSLQRRVVVIR